MGAFIKYVQNIFQKINISYPLVRSRMCVYQGLRHVSFSENDLTFLIHKQLLEGVEGSRKLKTQETIFKTGYSIYFSGDLTRT